MRIINTIPASHAHILAHVASLNVSVVFRV